MTTDSPTTDRASRVERPALDRLIENAKAKLAAMSPEEREAMFAAQRESWVRGEIGMGESSVMVRPSPVALELCEPGWAVVQEGVLLVKTVSPTRRAAIVNWIVTEAKQLVLQSWNDKKIEKVWNKRNIDAQVIEVAIAARTALPKALAEIADWKNVVEGQSAIIERVTRERDDALTNLDVLASAFKKFAPDLADELTRRWKDGTGDPLLAALAASTLSAAPELPKALAERGELARERIVGVGMKLLKRPPYNPGIDEPPFIGLPSPSRHGDVLKTASVLSIRNHDPDAQGFYTSTGRFVDRVEALQIATAAGQIIHQSSGPNPSELFSEDVW